MKKLITILFALSAWSAIAQPFWLPQNSPHPYRYADGKYWDLTKLFEYYKLPVDARISRVRGGRLDRTFKPATNPAPDWVYFNSPKVVGVHSEGILLAQGESVSFVKNLPGSKKLTDGDLVSFTAIRVGSHKYQRVTGSIATVPLYDYGIPYDPKQKGEGGKAKLLPQD